MGTVSYTAIFKDDVGIEGINLTTDKIELSGFNADISISGTGTERTVGLSNVQGEPGSGKKIIIVQEAAWDTAGNVTNATFASSLMFNYANMKDMALPSLRTSDGFSDADKISDWATEAVSTLYSAEILSGKGNGIFDPQGGATRAEVATMFMAFLESSKPSGPPDSTPPTISVGRPSASTIKNGGNLTTIVTFSDNVAVEKINMNASTITLSGFTANISADGTGNSRTIKLTNIQGDIGGGKYITVTEGAILDAAGNKNSARSSGEFLISN